LIGEKKYFRGHVGTTISVGEPCHPSAQGPASPVGRKGGGGGTPVAEGEEGDGGDGLGLGPEEEEGERPAVQGPTGLRVPVHPRARQQVRGATQNPESRWEGGEGVATTPAEARVVRDHTLLPTPRPHGAVQPAGC